jgi:hypothetical protein
MFQPQMLEVVLDSDVYKQSVVHNSDRAKIPVVLECVHGAKEALQSGHIDVLKVFTHVYKVYS